MFWERGSDRVAALEAAYGLFSVPSRDGGNPSPSGEGSVIIPPGGTLCHFATVLPCAGRGAVLWRSLWRSLCLATIGIVDHIAFQRNSRWHITHADVNRLNKQDE